MARKKRQMKIKELDKQSWYFDILAVCFVLALAGVFIGARYIDIEKPRLEAEQEQIGNINNRLVRINPGDTFQDHLVVINPYLEEHQTYQIGSADDQPFLEIDNVSGNNQSDAHYFRVSTNDDETLRIVRRLRDDRILFSRWISNGEVRIWERYDQLQEELANQPNNNHLNQQLIQLTTDYPDLTN